MKAEISKIDSSALYPIKSEDVSQRLEKAISQISEVAPVLLQTWNRSHSDLTWNAMNMNHETETRNLREIGASIQRKRDALTEAYFAYKENLLKSQHHEELAEKLQMEGENTLASLERLKAEKEKAHATMKHEAIQGATKDISILKENHDKVKGRIIEKHGYFDESIFELEEKEYWIKRLMIQAMRDVKECGRIKTGAQRDLEQIGIEPVEALLQIQLHISKIEDTIRKGGKFSRENRNQWLDAIVQKHKGNLEKKIEPFAVSTDHHFKINQSDDS
jgi:hypothetical protein